MNDTKKVDNEKKNKCRIYLEFLWCLIFILRWYTWKQKISNKIKKIKAENEKKDIFL